MTWLRVQSRSHRLLSINMELIVMDNAEKNTGVYHQQEALNCGQFFCADDKKVNLHFFS